MISTARDMINLSPEFRVYEQYHTLRMNGKEPVLSLYKGRLYMYNEKPSGLVAKIVSLISRVFNYLFFRFDFSASHIKNRITYLESMLQISQEAVTKNAQLKNETTLLSDEKSKVEGSLNEVLSRRKEIESNFPQLEKAWEDCMSSLEDAHEKLKSRNAEIMINVAVLKNLKKEIELHNKVLHSRKIHTSM